MTTAPARINFRDENHEPIGSAADYETLFVPRIGETVHPPGAGTGWRKVLDVVWMWPSPGSVDFLGKKGPTVDVICGPAEEPET